MTEPYYSDSMVTIYHGRCEDIVPGLGRFDLLLTDPPYGIGDAPFVATGTPGKRSGTARTNTWHPETDWDGAIAESWGPICCAASDTVAWFGHWRKRTEVEAIMPHPIRAEIIWAKDTAVGFPCPLAMRDERIWLFAKSGIKGLRYETSVWDEPIIPTWERKWHKNEKPLALIMRLLTWLIEPESGASVLDPFMGSGTTLVACRKAGIQSIGIDAEEKYCEIAAQRVAQRSLFEPEPAMVA